MRFILGAILILVTSKSIANDGEQLAKQKACLGCHSIQHIGISYPPAFVRVAKKYQGKEDDMAAVIRNGKGKMPAHPTLTDAEIKILVNWILGVKE